MGTVMAEQPQERLSTAKDRDAPPPQEEVLDIVFRCPGEMREWGKGTAEASGMQKVHPAKTTGM